MRWSVRHCKPRWFPDRKCRRRAAVAITNLSCHRAEVAAKREQAEAHWLEVSERLEGRLAVKLLDSPVRD